MSTTYTVLVPTLFALAVWVVLLGCAERDGGSDYRSLTPEEQRVIINKGTEPPFSGRYDNHYEAGVYTCKRCGTELFDSDAKFESSSGWPSFDDQIANSVKKVPDPDGSRTEIICANCGGHLGHVFAGEGLTPKNARYCVNSISLDFAATGETAGRQESQTSAPPETERAIFASGCFWGTEYVLKEVPGVISTTVGYCGGDADNPSYKQVCSGTTGHAESVEVVFDPERTSYEALARAFFETHDFTQLNSQGPDIGPQYRSAVFYLNEAQRLTAQQLAQQLGKKGHKVQTEITPAGEFWPAEDYHQDYYQKTGKAPYCHTYRSVF